MTVYKEHHISKTARNFCLLCIIFIGLMTVIGSTGGGGDGGGGDEPGDIQQPLLEDPVTPAAPNNENLEGYTITIPVTLASGLSGEIDEDKQLYIYLKRISTGELISNQYSTGDLPGDFNVPNVFSGEYEVGVVLDRNGDTQLDGDDFWGTVSTLLNVDKEDIASDEVVLHEYTLMITSPNEYTAVSSNNIHVEGTYTSDPDMIRISIQKGSMGPETIETIATKTPFAGPDENGGTFSGTLDISEIIGNGERFIMVNAEHQAVEEVHIKDSIPIILDRDEWESGIIIESPPSRSQVTADTLPVSGSYEGSPNSISVTMTINDTSDVIMAQVKMETGSFRASFSDTEDVENGMRVIKAVADYGGGIIENTSRQVFVNRGAIDSKTFRYRFSVSGTASQKFQVLRQHWTICPESPAQRKLGLPFNLQESVVFPIDEDVLPECVQGISDTYQRAIGLKVRYLNQVPDTYTFIIRLYINDEVTPSYIVSAENEAAMLEINASWSGDPEYDVFYYKVDP